MFNFEVSLWKVWNPKLWMSSFECLTLNAQFGGLTWSVGFTVREVPQKFQDSSGNSPFDNTLVEKRGLVRTFWKKFLGRTFCKNVKNSIETRYFDSFETNDAFACRRERYLCTVFVGPHAISGYKVQLFGLFV